MQPLDEDNKDLAKELRAGCWLSGKEENPKCRRCWYINPPGILAPSGFEEDERLPCGCLTVDSLTEKHMANEKWLADVKIKSSGRRDASATLGRIGRTAVMKFLNRQFSKYREEFLLSRNARALGALAASDLGQYIKFDETTTEGKGAKDIFEKYQAELKRNEEWQKSKDPA